MKITDFFNGDYVDFGGYDNYRKIGSLVDGLKPSARKFIFTMIDKNVKELKKLSILKASVSERTLYLHGDDSLVGVAVGLAQKFVGSNNIPLLKSNGNFGFRLTQEASADRYISAAKIEYLDKLFISDDFPVLIEQYFEGEQVEPKYFIPILPLLLINGSEGLSTGFAQKILPRNPLDVYDNIKRILDDKSVKEMIPFYKGFEGKIYKNENGGYSITGKFIQKDTQIIITEVPIGYDLKSYLSVLNSLEEKKEIVTYKDLSDTKKDKFNFIVTINRKVIKGKSEEQILEKLKLIKRVSENFTVLNENNKIEVFGNAEDLLKRYVSIRLAYYQKRKDYLIEKIKRDILILKNKLMFVREIINGNIIINKRTKSDIEGQLRAKEFDLIDDSYDYLLRMPIYSLTTEKLSDLLNEYKAKKEELEETKNKDLKVWYKEELDIFMKDYKKLLN